MKKITAFIFLFSLGLNFAKAQTGFAAEIVKLMNEARTNPTLFLKTYREEIKKMDATYIAYLEKTKPVGKIIWDAGLETMAKKQVENNELDPKYTGKNTICGYSSGKSSGSKNTALYYVCDLYKNIHDDDCAYIGLYISSNGTNYGFQLGMTCGASKLTLYAFTEKIDSSKVDFAKLNTAKNVAGISEQEKRMILEINFVRAYPKVYAKIIAKYLSDESKKNNGLKKDEYEAGMELIDELNKQEPRSILQPMACVQTAAKIHANDCNKRKIMAHEGSDGSYPWDRILKQCTSLKQGNENIAGAGGDDARAPVINLLLDDGISSRGHRYNMLDPKWVYVGCSRYVMEKNAYYTMWGWVQNFAY